MAVRDYLCLQMGFYPPTHVKQSMQIWHNLGRERSKINDLYFNGVAPTFPISFPTIMVRAVLRVFKVKVTVSKNALKPRLFSIGTPFLTLGSLGEQEAPWREECEQARHTSNPHSAAHCRTLPHCKSAHCALQIRSTHCRTLPHCKSNTAQQSANAFIRH